MDVACINNKISVQNQERNLRQLQCTKFNYFVFWSHQLIAMCLAIGKVKKIKSKPFITLFLEHAYNEILSWKRSDICPYLCLI